TLVCDRGGPGPVVRRLLRLDAPRPAFPRSDRPPPAGVVLRAGPAAGDDAVDAAAARAGETPRPARAAGAAAAAGGARLFPAGGAVGPGVFLGVGLQAAVVHLARHAPPGPGAGLLRGRRLCFRADPSAPPVPPPPPP